MHPRRTARALLLLLAVPALVVLLASPGSACSCAGGTSEADHLARASVVFEGEITARREPPLRAVWSSGDPAVYEVEVARVYKGEVPARAEVVTAVSGASCGLELPPSGPALLFVREVEGELRGGLCDGSRTGSGDPAVLGAGREPVRGQATPPPTAADDAGPVVTGGAVLAGLLVAGLAWRRRGRPG